MSVKSKSKWTFAKLCRQNTGTHFLDSGGVMGRQWQQPLPKDNPWLEVSKWTAHDGSKHQEVSAYIPLHTFLDSCLEIDAELTAKLRELEERDNEGCGFNIFESQEALSQELGIKAQTLDYTYNYDNDLTQNFQYAILSDTRDWYYADDTIVILETHNGADARGGFSTAVACRPTGMDGCSSMLDVVCGISIASGTAADGTELTHEQMQSLAEKWQVGYKSCPVYQFNNDVEEVLSGEDGKHGQEFEQVTVRLKTGETVTVYPSPRMG